jgi:DNA-binding PadR family transcriptional regulator
MPLRHTLLGLLNDRPMHGYLLRQHAKGYSWIYPMTNASIYPALHALEEDGFINHKSEIHKGRARKIYHITEAGRNDLHSWLLESVSQTPCFRDQMLLKIVMQSDETIRYARNWIADCLESLRVEIANYESNMSKMAMATNEQSLGMQLAHEYGFEMLRLRVRLLEKILAMTQETTTVDHFQRQHPRPDQIFPAPLAELRNSR